MVFAGAEGLVRVPVRAPTRPGIYLTEVVLPVPGSWTWTLGLAGDRPELPAVQVHPDLASAQQAATGWPETEGRVVMLKEQQWPVRLRAEAAAIRVLREQIRVAARVGSVPGQASRVLAPWSGRLQEPAARSMAGLGTRVAGGEPLARLRIPLLGADRATWEDARLQRHIALTQAVAGSARAAADLEAARAGVAVARSAFGRVRELHSRGARSERELEEARYRLESALAAEQAAAGSLRAWTQAAEELARGGSEDEDLSAPPEVELEILAPCDGTIVEVLHAPGEWVEEGAPLFRILDDSVLRVALRIPERDVLRLEEAPQAFLRHPLDGSVLELPGQAGRRLVVAPEIDGVTRSAEVVFETPNPGWLRVGMTLDAELATGAPRRTLAVPSTALVDEDGASVVYVQVAGETFDRRVVRTGLRADGLVEIVEGLEEGERIVVQGAAIVRLVSLTGAIPAHSH